VLLEGVVTEPKVLKLAARGRNVGVSLGELRLELENLAL
jgi:hypothetical protein